MECVREPPEWFLWVWHSGPASDQFVASIRLFKVGEERDVELREEPGDALRPARRWDLTAVCTSKPSGRQAEQELRRLRTSPVCGATAETQACAPLLSWTSEPAITHHSPNPGRFLSLLPPPPFMSCTRWEVNK